MVTTGHDGCLKITSLSTFQKRTFTVSNLALTCSALTSEKSLATGSYDNKLYFFNLDTGKTLKAIHAHDDTVTSCEFIEAQNAVATGSWDGHVKLWDIRTGQLVSNFDDH